MSNPVLRVEALAKVFRSYSHEAQRVLRWFGVDRDPAREDWVLKDISFDVHQGEAVAIAGQNGAGKSTLLKMITGTLRPTGGSIQVLGRISAILELGLGFDPDRTGRQNAFHASGLMGHQPDAIAARMDEIESFAEIGAYFDQPVRIYSSGMQMRVAFAVATAFRPDLLIVDEALSVGDTYFQHKSMERIREFRRLGTALLLVSHDKATVQSLCDRVILLDKGTILKTGAPADVMDFYNALIAQKVDRRIEQRAARGGRTQTISGSLEATIEDVRLCSPAGLPVETVRVAEPVELRIRAKVNAPIERLVFGYSIRDRLGQVIYGTNTHLLDAAIETPSPGSTYEMRARFPAMLGVGSYSLTIALTSDDRHLTDNFEWRDLALVFDVVSDGSVVFDGVAYMPPMVDVGMVAQDGESVPAA